MSNPGPSTNREEADAPTGVASYALTLTAVSAPILIAGYLAQVLVPGQLGDLALLASAFMVCGMLGVFLGRYARERILRATDADADGAADVDPRVEAVSAHFTEKDSVVACRGCRMPVYRGWDACASCGSPLPEAQRLEDGLGEVGR